MWPGRDSSRATRSQAMLCYLLRAGTFPSDNCLVSLALVSVCWKLVELSEIIEPDIGSKVHRTLHTFIPSLAMAIALILNWCME